MGNYSRREFFTLFNPFEQLDQQVAKELARILDLGPQQCQLFIRPDDHRLDPSVLTTIEKLNINYLLGEYDFFYLSKVLNCLNGRGKQAAYSSSGVGWGELFVNPGLGSTAQEERFAADNIRTLFLQGCGLAAIDGCTDLHIYESPPKTKIVQDMLVGGALTAGAGVACSALANIDSSRRQFLKGIGVLAQLAAAGVITVPQLINLIVRDLPPGEYKVMSHIVASQIQYEQQQLKNQTESNSAEFAEAFPVFSQLVIHIRNQIMALNTWYRLSQFDQGDTARVLLSVGPAHSEIGQVFLQGHTTLEARLLHFLRTLFSQGLDFYYQTSTRPAEIKFDMGKWALLFAEGLEFNRNAQTDAELDSRRMPNARSLFIKVLLERLNKYLPRDRRFQGLSMTYLNLVAQQITHRLDIKKFNSSSDGFENRQTLQPADFEFYPFKGADLLQHRVSFSHYLAIDVLHAVPIGSCAIKDNFHPVYRQFSQRGDHLVGVDIALLANGSLVKLPSECHYQKLASHNRSQWARLLNSGFSAVSLAGFNQEQPVTGEIVSVNVFSPHQTYSHVSPEYYLAVNRDGDRLNLDVVALRRN